MKTKCANKKRIEWYTHTHTQPHMDACSALDKRRKQNGMNKCDMARNWINARKWREIFSGKFSEQNKTTEKKKKIIDKNVLQCSVSLVEHQKLLWLHRQHQQSVNGCPSFADKRKWKKKCDRPCERDRDKMKKPQASTKRIRHRLVLFAIIIFKRFVICIQIGFILFFFLCGTFALTVAGVCGFLSLTIFSSFFGVFFLSVHICSNFYFFDLVVVFHAQKQSIDKTILNMMTSVHFWMSKLMKCWTI